MSATDEQLQRNSAAAEITQQLAARHPHSPLLDTRLTLPFALHCCYHVGHLFSPHSIFACFLCYLVVSRVCVAWCDWELRLTTVSRLRARHSLSARM